MSLPKQLLWGVILGGLVILNLVVFTKTTPNNTNSDISTFQTPPTKKKDYTTTEASINLEDKVVVSTSNKALDATDSIPDTEGLPQTDDDSPKQTTENRMIEQGLVNIKELIPDIKIDLKYATRHNFLNKVLYTDLQNCYLQKEAAEMLKKAQVYLKSIQPEYSLIVFDGARPRSIQKEMWAKVKGTPEQRYVANPYKGSIHNFGAAVDLSIVDEYGIELDMGTPYDFFGKLAQPRYEQQFFDSKELTREQLDNRALLRKAMKHAGFRGILSEWWHFNAFPKEVTRKKYSIIE